MPSFSDFLNSLLGLRPQQPAPTTTAGGVSHANLPLDDPNEPAQITNARVMLIIYNPIINSSAGVKLSDQPGWSDPDQLVNDFIGELLQVSGGMARYQIVQRTELNEFPILADGFQYTAQTFLSVLQGLTPPHTPVGVNYNLILSRFNILQGIANNLYDEVWVMGFPYAGFYESIMAGAGAFWCNAPALQGTSACPRRFVVMGFSYERSVGEMLHSYAHRCESILAQVFNCQGFLAWAYKPNRTPATVSPDLRLNLFQRFICFDQIAPGRAAVGTVHYAPNSTKDYDWNNQAAVQSECYDWLNFPNFKGDIRPVKNTEWGSGDDRLYQLWWLGHLPKVAGRQGGIHNNWWQYVANPNNVGV